MVISLATHVQDKRKYRYESREATFKTLKKKKDIDSDEPMREVGIYIFILYVSIY